MVWGCGRGGAPLVAMLMVLMAASAARAQTGRRVFIDPLVTEDATPDNELELAPGWNRESRRSDANFAWSVEKQFSKNFSIEVSCAFDSVSRSREHSSEGIDGTEILAKWAFFTSDEHEALVAIGADLFPSSGDAGKGAETHSRGGPLLLWEKGFGDLPDSSEFHYLRPFALQSEMGYFPTWGGPQADEFIFNLTIEYSLEYLADSGERLPMSFLTAPLVPFVEFNYDQIAIGRRQNTPPDFRVTPGLVYLFGPCQLTIGTQVALNHTASHNVQSAVLTLLDFDLDEIIPGAGWEAM
jgi:hypothetical protein